MNTSLVPYTPAGVLAARPPQPPAVLPHPKLALPQEPVHVQCMRSLDSPDAADIYLATDTGPFELVPADSQELVKSFGTPGATVPLFAQARNEGGESAIAVSQVEILRHCVPTTEFTDTTSLRALDAKTFAVGCKDAGILLYEMDRNRLTSLRTGPPGADAPLISPDGRALTPNSVVTTDRDGHHVFVTEFRVDGIKTGKLEGRFQLSPKETFSRFTTGNCIATRREVRGDYWSKYWRGEPISVAETPHQTQIYDLGRRIPVGAPYPGILIATSESGYGAIAYFFSDTIHFTKNIHRGLPTSTYHPETVRGTQGHQCLLCPSGEFALITAKHAITQGAFTFESTIWQVVRADRGARWMADLPEKLTPMKFVSENLLWAIDRSTPLARLVLYDWTTGKVVASMPFFESEERLLTDPTAAPAGISELLAESTREAAFSEFLNNMEIVISDDPIEPAALVSLQSTSGGGRELQYLRREEGFRVLHRVPLPVHYRDTSPVAATERRVYSTPKQGEIVRHDLASGRKLETLRLALPATAPPSPPGVVVGSAGPLVVYSGSYAGQDTRFWIFDERTESIRVWKAPQDAVDVSFLDGDDQGRCLLFAMAVGDPEADRAFQKEASLRAMAAMNRAFASAAEETQNPPPEEEPLERPTRQAGVAVVDVETGSIHWIAIPDPIKTTCWDAEKQMWLVQTAHERDEFNLDHSRLVRQVVELKVYAVSLDGSNEPVFKQEVESAIDERVTVHTSASDGRKWTSGKIFYPRFALSRAQPGRLAFASLTKIGMASAYTGEICWSSENPLCYYYGVPETIVPYPDGRLWVTVGSAGAALVDAEGHVEATDVASSYHEPVVTSKAILFKNCGIWQPLTK